MNQKVLSEFFSEDGDAYARQQLVAAMREGKLVGRVLQKFNFNRFNVSLDFAAEEVVIEDDLTLARMASGNLRCPNSRKFSSNINYDR